MTALATPPNVLSGMVAVSKDSDIEPLGFVGWFSVPDEDVAVSRLRRSWGLAGLDPRPLPKDPRAVDAFKRAVRDEERVGTYTDPQTRTRVETDVRDVLENAEDVIYQVTRVTRDLEDDQPGQSRVPRGQIKYASALKVWFSKETGDVDFKPIGGLTRKEVLPIMESIKERYDANGKTVTGAKVRTMVRNYIINDTDETDNLVGLSGESLGGSRKGVYFVLAKYKDQLEALAEMLHGLYKPAGRAFLYYVPMADGASEREMIRRHHAMNSREAIEKEMMAVRALLRPVGTGADNTRERAPRENVVKFHWRELERLRRRAGQYRDALREEVEDVDNHMDMLNRQLRKLMSL